MKGETLTSSQESKSQGLLGRELTETVSFVIKLRVPIFCLLENMVRKWASTCTLGSASCSHKESVHITSTVHPRAVLPGTTHPPTCILHALILEMRQWSFREDKRRDYVPHVSSWHTLYPSCSADTFRDRQNWGGIIPFHNIILQNVQMCKSSQILAH